jgi:hypothetical protein
MTDFLKSLSARSFGFEEGLDIVQPRLPSLFEHSQTNPAALEPWVFKESREPQNSSKEQSLTDITEFNVASSLRSFESAENRLNESPSFKAVEPNAYDYKINLHADSSPDRVSLSQNQLLRVKNRESDFTGSMTPQAIEEIIPVSKLGIGSHNKDQIIAGDFSESKPVNHSVLRSPVSSQSESELDSRSPKSTALSNNQALQSNNEPQHGHKQLLTAQPPNLVADASVLDQLIRDKIALHAKANPVEGGSAVNLPTRPTTILPRVDASKFGESWPNLNSNTQSLQIKTVNSGGEIEPTIQVTIGRIEIRAAQTSSTVRKNPAKNPSTMSLEEYLKKRNGGVR